MAQTAQINISINTQNAIKSIGELNNEIGGSIVTINDLELTIQSLSEELKSTEFGSERFKELQGALVEATGKMKDFDLSIEALDADQRAAEFGSFAAGIGDIATGALALTQAFGITNKEAEEFTASIVGGFAIANTFRGGLEGIISAQKLLKNSTLATKVATEGSTVSMKIFNAVVKANPIGILITAILAGVAAFAAWSFATDDGKKSAEELAEEMKKLNAEYKNNIDLLERRTSLEALKEQVKLSNTLIELETKLIAAEDRLNDLQRDQPDNLRAILKAQKEVNAIQLDMAGERLYAELEVFDAISKAEDERKQEIMDTLKVLDVTTEEGKTLYKELVDERGRLGDLQYTRNLRRQNLENELTLEGEKIVIDTENRIQAIQKQINDKKLQDRKDYLDKMAKADDDAIEKLDKEREEERQKELSQEEDFAEKLNTKRLTQLNKGLKEELKLSEDNEEEQVKIKEKYNQLIIDSEIEKVKELIAVRKAYGEDVTDLELQLSQLEIQALESTTEATKQFLTEKQQEIIDFVMGSVTQALGIMDQALTEVAERQAYLREIELQKNTEALDKQLANRTITEEQYNNKLGEIQRTREAQELQARRKAFKQEKAFNLASATMSVAQAILSILAQSPDPLKPIGPLVLAQLATAGALGAAQIGVIAGQQFRAARGGVVPGAPSMTDSVSSLLAPGEMVINSNSSSMFGELLSAVNQMGGGIPLTPIGPTKSTGDVKDSVYVENRPQSIVKAYVVETEITNKQKKISRIQRSSEF